MANIFAPFAVATTSVLIKTLANTTAITAETQRGSGKRSHPRWSRLKLAIAPGPRPKPKKSAKEKNRETQVNATLVETKVDELALLVAEQIQTPEQARVELSEWCKQWERDRFAASKLFEAKLAEINNTKVTLSQARQQLERLVTEGVEDSDIEIAIAQLCQRLWRVTPNPQPHLPGTGEAIRRDSNSSPPFPLT